MERHIVSPATIGIIFTLYTMYFAFTTYTQGAIIQKNTFPSIVFSVLGYISFAFSLHKIIRIPNAYIDQMSEYCAYSCGFLANFISLFILIILSGLSPSDNHHTYMIQCIIFGLHTTFAFIVCGLMYLTTKFVRMVPILEIEPLYASPEIVVVQNIV